MLVYKIFTWDWKEVPKWDDINGYVNILQQIPYFHSVETNADWYAVVVANKPLSNDAVKEIFTKYTEQ